MAPSAVAVPTLLTNPGYLFIAPLATSAPTNTVVGSVFTDSWSGSWLPLGATEAGTTFTYQTTVQPFTVAEYFDPIKYFTTDRSGSIAFNLANWALSNYNRALNGGVAALTATSGSGTTALYTVTPPAVGSETRCMIGWESLDNTLRLVCYQTLQGGAIASAFQKPPSVASIPCTFNLEIPSGGTPFSLFSAGTARG
jgi:hypothetical protein